MREPISFVTFTYNCKDKLPELISAARRIVGQHGEVIVVDQSSTDGTRELAESLADRVIVRRRKGYPDPDRNMAYAAARNRWIFTLDSDELPDETLAGAIPEAIKNENIHLWWLRRKNLVEGADIKEVLGDDWQPRLFRKGVIVYSGEMHTHPEVKSPMQGWLSHGHILHERTLPEIETTHKNRMANADPEKRQLEEEFIKKVKSIVGREEEPHVGSTKVSSEA